MLESLQTGRVNVTNLVLEPPPKSKSTFNSDDFLSTNDLRDLNWMFRLLRRRFTPPYERQQHSRNFNDFTRLVIITSILAPQQLEGIRSDETLWSDMNTMKDSLYQSDLVNVGSYKWEDDLIHHAAMKTLFPDKWGKNGHADGLEEATTDNMIGLIRTISEYEEPTWAFLSAGILFPSSQPKFRVGASMFAEQSNYWKRMQAMNDPRFTVTDGHPHSQMIERSLLLKLLYPERTAELNLKRISLPRFRAELEDPSPRSTSLELYRRVAAAKLLFANDIQFTEKGIVAVYERPVLEDTAPNMPEVRRF